MRDIKLIRKEIDVINQEIVDLLNKRLDLVKEIIQIKEINNLPMEDLVREKEILDKLDCANLSKEFVEELFGDIFRYSKNFR